MEEKVKSSVKWWVLVASCLMILINGLDATAVNLILAPLSTSLHIPTATLQWIISSYLLIFAACIVAGGRLGDILGQKKILIIGLIGFFIGSIFAAAAVFIALLLDN